MFPLIDTHCHVHPGLDDGPADWDEALEMCSIAWNDGVRAVAATAHQSPSWPRATPERIRRSTRQLQRRLEAARIPLDVYPCAEVMVDPDLPEAWIRGELLSVADTCHYLLIEFPTGVFVDLSEIVTELVESGVRPILAHPERCAELLHAPEAAADLIRRGCLMQVTADSLTDQYPQLHGDLRSWLRRGWVHLVASDGHSPHDRPPEMAEAFEKITRWTSPDVAERLCCSNGMAVLEGLPLVVPHPHPPKRKWFSLRV
ncbi:MAG: protein tyrosine phosphatase [Planctomycetes bacterium]|nr:protein tyrosine phosphatase [Planctomycetota bacterium]MBL7043150.1 protein tyrosine phosphatase [Pirellulaceae bacterium]